MIGFRRLSVEDASFMEQALALAREAAREG